MKLWDTWHRTQGEVETPNGLMVETAERFSSATALNLLVVAAGRKGIWLLPTSRYAFWVPKQAGRAAREIEVPPCLHATGTEVRGSDAGKVLLDAAQTDAQRAALEEVIANTGEGLEFVVPTTFLGWASSYRDRIGVIVREKGARYRLDVWDTVFEAPVAVRYLPAAIGKPGRLVLTGEAAWVIAGGRFHRVPLPELMVEPIAGLCDKGGYLDKVRATEEQGSSNKSSTTAREKCNT